MSELSEYFGARYGTMDCFFRSRLARSASGGPYALDLTSVSTYSEMGEWSKWGHNRDGENLRQTEMVLVTDSEAFPSHSACCQFDSRFLCPEGHGRMDIGSGMRLQAGDGSWFRECRQHRRAPGHDIPSPYRLTSVRSRLRSS